MSHPYCHPDNNFFCSRPWTGFEIEHDGTVKMCCMQKQDSFGNINNESIEEIWNGKYFKEARQKMKLGQWKDTCKSECPRLYSNFEDPSPSPNSEVFSDNYQQNIQEIKQRASDLTSWPRFWKITDSTLCNLDCIMCYQDRKDLRSLPEKFYLEIGKYYNYIQEIQIIGGEPFAIRRFRELLEEFSNFKYPDTKFAFVTNGTIYDSNTISLLKNIHVSWLSISLDAATEPIYAKIRRGGDLSNTLKGCREWISLGKKMGFPVTISLTVMKDNIDQIPLFIKLARDLGVDCLFGIIGGEKDDQHILDVERLKSSLAIAKNLVAPLHKEMPMANLTLETVESNLK